MNKIGIISQETMQIHSYQILNVKIFLIPTDSGNLLIDTGIPGTEKKIIKAFQFWGIAPDSVSLIILSHGHLDHIGCLNYIQEITGAKVLCHSSYGLRLAAGEYEEAVPRSLFWKIFNNPVSRLLGSRLKSVQPDILIDDFLDLNAFGLKGSIIYTPGHSPGSISVLIGSGDVLAGDLIRTNRKGDIDTGLFYSNRINILASLESIAKHQPNRIHLSHGRTITGDELKLFLEKERDWIP